MEERVQPAINRAFNYEQDFYLAFKELYSAERALEKARKESWFENFSSEVYDAKGRLATAFKEVNRIRLARQKAYEVVIDAVMREFYLFPPCKIVVTDKMQQKNLSPSDYVKTTGMAIGNEFIVIRPTAIVAFFNRDPVLWFGAKGSQQAVMEPAKPKYPGMIASIIYHEIYHVQQMNRGWYEFGDKELDALVNDLRWTKYLGVKPKHIEIMKNDLETYMKEHKPPFSPSVIQNARRKASDIIEPPLEPAKPPPTGSLAWMWEQQNLRQSQSIAVVEPARSPRTRSEPQGVASTTRTSISLVWQEVVKAAQMACKETQSFEKEFPNGMTYTTTTLAQLRVYKSRIPNSSEMTCSSALVDFIVNSGGQLTLKVLLDKAKQLRLYDRPPEYFYIPDTNNDYPGRNPIQAQPSTARDQLGKGGF